VSRIIVITGTDTGVGKTILTALLLGDLRRRGINAIALKPICSGGREDAERLLGPMDGTVTLDEINPWHFREPLAPTLSARREGRKVLTREVVKFVRSFQRRFDVVLVEGAGGVLSPLTADGSTRELVSGLKAESIVVGRNQLGVVNHVRLTLEALDSRSEVPVVLMAPQISTPASRTNVNLLQEILPRHSVFTLPFFKKAQLNNPSPGLAVRKVLRRLVD
jgi:dethiobiotin synthetase